MVATPTRLGYQDGGWSTGTVSAVHDLSAIPNGSWMVLTAIHALGSGSTFTTPAGWTIVAPPTVMGTRSSNAYGKIKAAGDTNVSITHTAAQIHSGLMWGAGADTVDKWILGTVQNRATSGGTFTNTAPSITTTKDNTLVLMVSFEATATTESAITSASNNTQYAFLPQTSSSFLETIYYGYLDKVTAGATGAMGVTYPNTQGSNGSSSQIGIPPAAAPANVAPTASFTQTKTNLSVAFNAAASSDSDGTIASYAWNFGDSATGTTVNPTHVYAAAGTYTVSLTVTDNLGATGTTSHAVTVTAAAVPGLPVSYGNGTAKAAARLFYGDGATKLTPKKLTPVPFGKLWTPLLAKSGFVVAHRGGSVNWPEMSMIGYTNSVIDGADALEYSLARTSDGVFFGLHDANTDQTSGTTGAIAASTKTWAQIQALSINPVATDNQAQPAQPYMRIEDLIAAYSASHTLFIDPKYVSSADFGDLLHLMDAVPNANQKFCAKSYFTGTPWADAAGARGYPSWGYFYDSDYQADNACFDQYGGHYTTLGLDYSAPTATWTKAKSYGKPVIGHIAPTLAAYNTAMAQGAAGVMTSGIRQVLGDH